MKRTASLVLVVGAALAGCTASETAPASGRAATVSPSPSSTAWSGPKFAGPYAAELADAFARSQSAFEREALADGKVTDAEEAEMIERLRSCLASHGFRLVSYKKTGAQEIDTRNSRKGPDATNEAVELCQTSSGSNTVGLIHEAMLTNPQNIDLVPKIIACLKKNHLVGAGYDKTDYQRGLPQFGDDRRTAQVQQCNDDPLNRIKGE